MASSRRVIQLLKCMFLVQIFPAFKLCNVSSRSIGNLLQARRQVSQYPSVTCTLPDSETKGKIILIILVNFVGAFLKKKLAIILVKLEYLPNGPLFPHRPSENASRYFSLTVVIGKLPNDCTMRIFDISLLQENH